MSEHDLESQIDRLRQALEGSRRPLSLFLGAGCPMAVRVGVGGGSKPLVPDIKGMTEILAGAMREKKKESFEKLEAVLEEDDRADADLEFILSFVRALRDVAGSKEARGLSGEDLKGLDEAISNEIAALAEVDFPSMSTPYHQAMRWVGGASRVAPVEIFTTNYDLLSEQALEQVGVPYFDGFVGAKNAFFDIQAIEDDSLPARWARLWKLHGSINWSLAEDDRVVRQPSSNAIKRRLIHPSHLKYDESRRMPYLALHDRLRTVLRQPNLAMVACGYSFRDKHLNEVLHEGLVRNPSAVLFGLLFGKLDDYSVARDLAVNGRARNLVILARDKAVIGGTVATWRQVDDPERARSMPGVSLNGTTASSDLGDFASFAGLLGDLAGTRR